MVDGSEEPASPNQIWVVIAVLWLVGIPVFVGLWFWMSWWVLLLVAAAVVVTGRYVGRAGGSRVGRAVAQHPIDLGRIYVHETQPGVALHQLWDMERRGRQRSSGDTHDR